LTTARAEPDRSAVVTSAPSAAARSRLTFAGLVVAALAPALARAEPAPSAARSETPPSQSAKEARELFAQGQIHYSLGEYEQAIAQFRRAYELTSAPGLLFNIAQAHRLNGDCKQALAIYRHFVRMAPDSEYRPEAETQIAALVVRCEPAPAPLDSASADRKRPPPALDITAPLSSML